MKTGGMIKKDVGTPARFVLPALLAAVMAIVMTAGKEKAQANSSFAWTLSTV